MKAERIRVALEKIKEAQVKKVGPPTPRLPTHLCPRVHALTQGLERPLRLLVVTSLSYPLPGCISLGTSFILSQAVELRENRSLQCLIVWICRGGSAKSESGFRKEGSETMQMHKTSHLRHPNQSTDICFFNLLSEGRTTGCFESIKVVSYVHWEVDVGPYKHPFIYLFFHVRQ